VWFFADSRFSEKIFTNLIRIPELLMWCFIDRSVLLSLDHRVFRRKRRIVL